MKIKLAKELKNEGFPQGDDEIYFLIGDSITVDWEGENLFRIIAYTGIKAKTTKYKDRVETVITYKI